MAVVAWGGTPRSTRYRRPSAVFALFYDFVRARDARLCVVPLASNVLRCSGPAPRGVRSLPTTFGTTPHDTAALPPVGGRARNLGTRPVQPA